MKTNKVYDRIFNSVRATIGFYRYLLYLGSTVLILMVACTSTTPSSPPPKLKKPQKGQTAPVVPIISEIVHSDKLPWTIAIVSTGVLFYRSKTRGRLQRKLVAAIKTK